MVSRAAGVQGLRKVNQGRGTVTLTHKAVPGATSYEMQQCVNGSNCTRYGQTYNIRSLPITVRLANKTQSTYTFRVRSNNSCGWGAYSNAVPVTLTTGPSPMCLTATSSRCDVALQWKRPANGGSGITSYNFEVMNSQGRW